MPRSAAAAAYHALQVDLSGRRRRRSRHILDDGVVRALRHPLPRFPRLAGEGGVHERRERGEAQQRRLTHLHHFKVGVQEAVNVFTAASHPRRDAFSDAVGLARARRRVALGGSVTSGLPFGTFTGDDHRSNRWLYHRKLASYMATQWPRTQAEALNRSHNCGLPAIGPAFATLCLHSLLPPAGVDLVLLEYGINIQTDSDAQWFELLVRKLLGSSRALALIAISSWNFSIRSL